MNTKLDLLTFKCLCCNRNYKNDLDEDLMKPFFNKYTFRKLDINKFILKLQKGFYPYKYIVHWDNLLRLSCLKKKFYSDPKHKRYY